MRKRHQTGSVQQRMRAGKMCWFGLYRDADGKRQITGPLEAKTKSQAMSRMAEFLIPINKERSDRVKDANMTLAGYCEQVYIPYGLSGKWKGSTGMTTPQRIRQHIAEGELGSLAVSGLNREILQNFLNKFAGCAADSVVRHLKFDLQAICRLAHTDGLIQQNPAPPRVLYTPKGCRPASQPVMTVEQVKIAIAALDLRERAFCRLALFAGMRPGEIIALRWSDIDGSGALIDDRIYRGISDDPKNNKKRNAALATKVLADLHLWRQFAAESEYVFASENGLTPIKYENIWQRNIKPRFEKLGLEWADFRCMRRTNSSLMREHGADLKTVADQQGHGIDVAENVYNHTSLAAKLTAVNLLESVIQ